MNKRNSERGYSLAEAMVTMLVMVLIILMAVPSFIGKHSKKVSYVIGPDKHGVIECKDDENEECDIVIEGDETRDLFIIATGGGGGGGGSFCGETEQTIRGDLEKPVEGHCSFNSQNVLYFDASGAGGGSSQGFCDKYPLEQFDLTSHKKGCNEFPNTTISERWYEEVATPVTKECWGMDDTDVCEKMGTNNVCEKWKQEKVWRARPVVPAEYTYSVEVDESKTKTNSAKCDLNPGKMTCECNPNACPAEETAWFPHVGWKVSHDKVIDYGVSYQATLTKRANVCSIDWVYAHQGQAGVAEKYPTYCNAALYGGRGGSGQRYTQRLCPAAFSTECLEWRDQHKVASFCTNEQYSEQAASKDGVCPYGAITIWPGFMNDNFLKYLPESIKTMVRECNTETLRRELREKDICGHDSGEYNCVVPHGDMMKRTCNKWRIGSMKTKFKIGPAGEAGPGLYTMPGKRGEDSTLFIKEEKDHGGGVSSEKPGIANMQNDLKINGGDAGRFSLDGSDQKGVKGGEHYYYDSGRYNAVPVNTQPGGIGYVRCAEKWLGAGLGGDAGETKAGYLKNVSGTVKIKLGEGGAGGDGSSIGANGWVVVDIISHAIKSLYTNSILEKYSSVFWEKSSVFNSAKGNSGGATIITSKKGDISAGGGSGGDYTMIYETCSAGSDAFYDGETEASEYSGKLGKKSDTGKGNGGDGIGGTPGSACKGQKGSKGEKGEVIIFY